MDKRNPPNRYRKSKFVEKQLPELKEKSIQQSVLKERKKQLSEKGELLEKAGVLFLDYYVFYGALLSIAELITQPDVIQAWSRKGYSTLHQAIKSDNQSLIMLQFPTKPSSDVLRTIRCLGLRWDSTQQGWRGFAPIQHIQAIVDTHDAKLTIFPE